ncbi:carboxypeptidase-like regulatory domain-containing protein [Persicitalea sp.]|uniref:carboxypeptidase-like regulatory domain-containing protein n=1 Tax=Persicitalea sp. TaxID=3100273 RepID=UPI003593AD19
MVFVSNFVFSQNTGAVIGTVKDGKTREGLVGVTIQAEGSNSGTTTDIDGKYRLELPVGSYNLKATIVGYAPLTKFNVVMTSGNAQQINFDLLEEAVQLEGRHCGTEPVGIGSYRRNPQLGAETYD